MAEPTLQQVFGANALQTAGELVISKSDLVTLGLTASETNTAESLIVSLILLAGQYLKEENQDTNPDIQVTINQSATPSIVTRNSTTYRQVTFDINLQTVDNNSAIDPDNY